MTISERLRRRLELRRSNAAVPHRNKAHDAPADWLAEWEEEIESWEPGELYSRNNHGD